MGESVGRISNVLSYVYTMLENGAKDLFKKRSREMLTDDSIDAAALSAEEKVLVSELKQVILHAIETLDAKHRYVFVETELKGRSYEELIAETGEKAGTLLSRKSRAKKRLQDRIQDYLSKEDHDE